MSCSNCRTRISAFAARSSAARSRVTACESSASSSINRDSCCRLVFCNSDSSAEAAPEPGDPSVWCWPSTSSSCSLKLAVARSSSCTPRNIPCQCSVLARLTRTEAAAARECRRRITSDCRDMRTCMASNARDCKVTASSAAVLLISSRCGRRRGGVLCSFRPAGGSGRRAWRWSVPAVHAHFVHDLGRE